MTDKRDIVKGQKLQTNKKESKNLKKYLVSKEFLIPLIVGCLFGFLANMYFSDNPVLNVKSSPITGNTLDLEITNNALFKGTGEIRIYDEEDDYYILSSSMNPGESKNFSIELTEKFELLAYNVTPGYAIQITLDKYFPIIYKIGCSYCNPQIYWAYSAMQTHWGHLHECILKDEYVDEANNISRKLKQQLNLSEDANIAIPVQDNWKTVCNISVKYLALDLKIKEVKILQGEEFKKMMGDNSTG